MTDRVRKIIYKEAKAIGISGEKFMALAETGYRIAFGDGITTRLAKLGSSDYPKEKIIEFFLVCSLGGALKSRVNRT